MPVSYRFHSKGQIIRDKTFILEGYGSFHGGVITFLYIKKIMCEFVIGSGEINNVKLFGTLQNLLD